MGRKIVLDRNAVIEKQNMMKTTFRRNSLVDQGREVIDRQHMITVFDRLGQSVDEEELNKYMDKIDSENSGLLDYEAFTKICGKFLKDPAALAKSKKDHFAFRHLVNLTDFKTE